MIYFVKIILESIKKNPRAGQTVTIIPRETRFTFNITGENKSLEWVHSDKDFLVTETRFLVHVGKHIVTMEGFLRTEKTEEAYEKLKACSALGVFGVQQAAQKVQHAPEPTWLYSHENIKIECSNCGEESLIFDLGSDSISDEDCDSYSNRICPHCKIWDCCDLEFESIGDALKRSVVNPV